MLSVSYASKNVCSAGKSSGVLRGGTSGANRCYVLAHCAPPPLLPWGSSNQCFFSHILHIHKINKSAFFLHFSQGINDFLGEGGQTVFFPANPSPLFAANSLITGNHNEFFLSITWPIGIFSKLSNYLIDIVCTLQLNIIWKFLRFF